MAEAEIYLVMASILKVFKIEYPLDEEGKPYVPETKYDSGVLRLVVFLSESSGLVQM